MYRRIRHLRFSMDSRLPYPHGFTLLEVVVAIGVFSIGMVAIIGLFAPITKNVTSARDAESASRVIEGVIARLRTLPFASVAALLKTDAEIQADDAKADCNPNDSSKEKKILFASSSGEKVGLAADSTVWVNGDGDKFFEIALIRNVALSPAANDATPPLPLFLAFSVRVRWPAFQPTSSGGAQQVGANASTLVPFDHSQQQVMYFTGSVTR